MFMEMSTLFLKKIKKFLSLFLWLFALGNDRINEVVFQKEKSGMEGIALDKTAECKLVLDTAVLAGKIMLQSGAEIHRVEDTIHRILKVSGMKTAEAFVMPTGLIVTLDDPRMDSMTVVKRIKTRGTNLSRIAEVNDISRRFCSGNISLEEAFHSLKHMKQYTYTALQKYIAQIMVAFFFAILLINATHSHAELQKGFSIIPGKHFLDNLRSVANDGSFPMFRGIINSVIVSGCSAALCTYFSSLTAYGIYAYDFKGKKVAFTFIMAILVMPTQVTAMGFLRLITKMGMYDSLLPLIIPSIASPAVFYFMYSYLQSSLPLSLVEAARIDGSGEFHTFNRIVLPIMKPAIAVQAIFTFVGSWNNYFVPALVIQSKNKMTVPILIATLRGADYMNFDMGKIYMMITVAIVPIIIVYLLLSKYIIAGVTLGGVKE